jgi:2-acylglycerol O-acyltransferase 2
MLSATIVQKMLAKLRVEGAIASVLFRIPFLRQICHWFGARPATHKNMNKVLGSGHSVGLMAGGIAEIFLANRHTEKIYLKKRKGFIKLALEHGAALVPVYYFGNTQLFDFSANRTLSKISRQFRMSLLVYFGRWYLPVPYQEQITMIIGSPIEVPHIASPTDAQVDEYHQKFVEAISEMYTRYAPVVGWHDKPLVVV